MQSKHLINPNSHKITKFYNSKNQNFLEMSSQDFSNGTTAFFSSAKLHIFFRIFFQKPKILSYPKNKNRIVTK